MMLNRTVILAVLVAASAAFAQDTVNKPQSPAAAGQSVKPADAVIAPVAGDLLQPRQPLPKRAFVVKPAGESRLAIKFRDDLKVRARPDKTIGSATDANLAEVNAVVEQFHLGFTQTIKVPQAELDALTDRAAANSGRAQPDLAGMMFIEGPAASLQAAANALLALDSVEYVFFKTPWTVFDGDGTRGPGSGACCMPDSTCVVTTEAGCTFIGGAYLGDGTTCASNPCLVPGACCMADESCVEALPFTCAITLGGTYQGGNTSCTPTLCHIPVPGACCLPNTFCMVVTASECATAGGIFMGEGTSCAPNPCLAAGACCMPDGSCFLANLTKCDSSGGTFMGAGTNCDPNLCPPPPAPGACCFPDGTCTVTDESSCLFFGGTYQGDGTTCTPGLCEPPPPGPGPCCVNMGGGVWDCIDLSPDDCELAGGVFRAGYVSCLDAGVNCDIDCGDPDLGSCFVVHGSPWCSDSVCCELVGSLRAFCVDEVVGSWDDICVELANLLCDIPPADRCATPRFNASCYEVHSIGGCNDPTCCNLVCGLDSYCCEVQWDATCQAAAYANCPFPGGGGTTPNLSNFQGYLRGSPYNGQFAGAPEPLCPAAPDDAGFTGDGMGLFDETGRWIDDPNMQPPAQRYAGLYGLGRELFETYHIGQTNPPGSSNVNDLVYNTRGKGVKVAVIEWSIFKDHEDLDVISEPGQTLITIVDVTHPDHATACMGIINAQDNGFGMVGIAPDADAYFFPLTSVEEGPRMETAFIRCYSTLGPGDVVSCSFGPPPTNLNSEEFGNTLLRLGTDLGITVCIAAGNSCYNLDNADDLTDSGAIVVGACSPGFPFSRLTFSNFYRDAAATSSQRVHVSAWGECVPTLATREPNLWFPDGDWDRSYGNAFNGTSAAAPQVAGLVACLQGLAKQFFGVPLMPAQIRAAVIAAGFPQHAMPIPPGFPQSFICAPDFDPDSPPNRIGPYIRYPRAGAAQVLTNIGFDESPLVDDVVVIRGGQVFGNRFSIKASDDNYLVVQSIFTNRNYRPTGVPYPATLVTYLATGHTVDLMVSAHSPTRAANSMTVEAEVVSPDPAALMMTEMFDWNTHRWSFVGFDPLQQDLPGDPDFVYTHIVTTGAQRFIQPSTLKVYIRLYIFSGNPNIGTGGDPTAGSSVMRVDRVRLLVGTGFGGVGTDPGPGGNGGP